MATGPRPLATVAGDFGVSRPVFWLIVYRETPLAEALIEPSLATQTLLPCGSIAIPYGNGPVRTVDGASGVSASKALGDALY